MVFVCLFVCLYFCLDRFSFFLKISFYYYFVYVCILGFRSIHRVMELLFHYHVHRSVLYHPLLLIFVVAVDASLLFVIVAECNPPLV